MNDFNQFDSNPTPQTQPSQSTQTGWNSAATPSNQKKLSLMGAVIIIFVFMTMSFWELCRFFRRKIADSLHFAKAQNRV